MNKDQLQKMLNGAAKAATEALHAANHRIPDVNLSEPVSRIVSVLVAKALDDPELAKVLQEM